MIIHTITSKKQVGASCSPLRRGIQIALTSGLLASGVAGAQLRDHGPADGTNFFPDWYRDNNGLALGQCIEPDESANGPLCLLAGTAPGRFPGNFGEEGFFATADVVIPLTGGNFHWMGHLEMAYMTPDGLPPVTRTATSPAADKQEVVFSRERMIFDVPAGCAGHYTIRTPFKVHEFDLEVGRRALFFTDDILPVTGDFNAALKGHTGPFLIWDGPQPAVTVAQPVGSAHNYVGDPNVLHTFTGSTLPAGVNHPEHTFNNYVEVIPPTTCDLGAGVGQPMFEENGSISGLVWDLPIADPVVITKTAFSHNATTSSLNVWATGPANKKLILSAATDTSQQLPSVQLKEEVNNDGVRQGKYFGHLEFSPTTNTLRRTRPAQITVTNLDSVPSFNTSRAVDDAVIITKAVYDPATTTLCVAAHSGDEDTVNAADMSLEAPAFGPFTAPTTTCPGVAANDKVLEKNLSTFLPPEFRFPPEGIVVKSSKGGTESVQPLILASGSHSDAGTRAWAVNDTFAIDGTGVTTLDLTANDPNAPANGRIVIVGQPEIGSVIAGATGGSVAFNAVEGMPTGPQTFYYAIQNTANGVVGNVGKVTLNVTQVIPAPIAVADAQGVFRTSTGAIIRILNNDVTGLTTTPIDPASVQLEPLVGYTLGAGGKSLTGPRGTVTALADGTLRYVPSGQGGTANNTVFTVQYTVANTSGNGRRSAPVSVRIVLKSAAEAVAFQRSRGVPWDVRFTSSYAGAAGTVTLAPAATCRLYANTTAYANGTGTAIGIIGTSLPGAGTNAYVVAGATPALPAGNTWVVGCVTSSGGRGQRTGLL